jgi:hypothetical protein
VRQGEKLTEREGERDRGKEWEGERGRGREEGGEREREGGWGVLVNYLPRLT